VNTAFPAAALAPVDDVEELDPAALEELVDEELPLLFEDGAWVADPEPGIPAWAAFAGGVPTGGAAFGFCAFSHCWNLFGVRT
jgi:hypothetical protein